MEEEQKLPDAFQAGVFNFMQAADDKKQQEEKADESEYVEYLYYQQSQKLEHLADKAQKFLSHIDRLALQRFKL